MLSEMLIAFKSKNHMCCMKKANIISVDWYVCEHTYNLHLHYCSWRFDFAYSKQDLYITGSESHSYFFLESCDLYIQSIFCFVDNGIGLDTPSNCKDFSFFKFFQVSLSTSAVNLIHMHNPCCIVDSLMQHVSA